MSTVHHWSSGPPGLCYFYSTIFLTPEPMTLGPEQGTLGVGSAEAMARLREGPASLEAQPRTHLIQMFVLVECPDSGPIGFSPKMLLSVPGYLDKRTWAL